MSVATHPGQALGNAPLIVGPTAAANASVATAAASGNVRVAFSGPLQGPCTSTDGNGTEVTAPCGSGLVTASAQFFEVSCLVGVYLSPWPHTQPGVGL